MTLPKLEIVVSSCDAYSDCWMPFFTLLNKFWPDCPYPITLISESKRYVNSSALRVETCTASEFLGTKSRYWGARLIECLKRKECDTILYLQEDFFLKDQVDDMLIAEFATFVSQMSWTHQESLHIGLSPMSSHGPFHLTEHPLLWEVGNRARYRFSLLPGIWRRSDLLYYLRPNETAWDFEECSHFRGSRSRRRVLTVNRHVFRLDGRQVYPFDPSGIMRGKWVRKNVVDLFNQNKIEVDFGRRGFMEDSSHLLNDNDNLYLQIKSRLKAKLRLPLRRVHDWINYPIDRLRY